MYNQLHIIDHHNGVPVAVVTGFERTLPWWYYGANGEAYTPESNTDPECSGLVDSLHEMVGGENPDPDDVRALKLLQQGSSNVLRDYPPCCVLLIDEDLINEEDYTLDEAIFDAETLVNVDAYLDAIEAKQDAA